jgi:hypothetical protein
MLHVLVPASTACVQQFDCNRTTAVAAVRSLAASHLFGDTGHLSTCTASHNLAQLDLASTSPVSVAPAG